MAGASFYCCPPRLRRNLKRRQRLALRPSRPNRVQYQLPAAETFFPCCFSAFIFCSRGIHKLCRLNHHKVTSRHASLRAFITSPITHARPPVADTERVVIFLSFYSSSDTCPQYLSAANTSCSGARSPLRSMEKRVPQSTKRATGAPSAVLAYGVGLIPHLFVPSMLLWSSSRARLQRLACGGLEQLASRMKHLT